MCYFSVDPGSRRRTGVDRATESSKCAHEAAHARRARRFFSASLFFWLAASSSFFYVVASRTLTPPRRRRDVARLDGITRRGDVIAATSRLRRASIAATIIVEGVAATLSPRDFTPSSRHRLPFTPSLRDSTSTSTPSPRDKTPSPTQAATGASSACTRYQTTRPSSSSPRASTTRWPSTRRRAARRCRCRTAPRRCRPLCYRY